MNYLDLFAMVWIGSLLPISMMVYLWGVGIDLVARFTIWGLLFWPVTIPIHLYQSARLCIRRWRQERREVWYVEHPGIRGPDGMWWHKPGRYAQGTYADALRAYGAYCAAGDTGVKLACLEPEVRLL